MTVFVIAGVVLPLLVEREEAVEFHHRAGSAQVDDAAGSGWRLISAVVRSSSADSIWLATVRSQISS